MRNRDFIIIAVNNYSRDKRQRWHLLMAKSSEVPVDLQELEEEEERVDSLDRRLIRTLSGMWMQLLRI